MDIENASEHTLILEIEKRYLRDLPADDWTEDDCLVYNYLQSIIYRLNSGEGLYIESDNDEIAENKKFIKIFKEMLKLIKEKDIEQQDN